MSTETACKSLVKSTLGDLAIDETIKDAIIDYMVDNMMEPAFNMEFSALKTAYDADNMNQIVYNLVGCWKSLKIKFGNF